MLHQKCIYQKWIISKLHNVRGIHNGNTSNHHQYRYRHQWFEFLSKPDCLHKADKRDDEQFCYLDDRWIRDTVSRQPHAMLAEHRFVSMHLVKSYFVQHKRQVERDDRHVCCQYIGQQICQDQSVLKSTNFGIISRENVIQAAHPCMEGRSGALQRVLHLWQAKK